jgi:hypothetical protein
MKTKQTTKDNSEKPALTVNPPTGFAKPIETQVISDEHVKFTREKAEEILKLSTFEGERIVNDRHVQNLYIAWASGRFMWEHVVIGLCECEGKTYRVNGQHTCWLRANIQNGPDPTVRLVTYKVKNQENLRSLYATFDRNKTRTYGHVFKSSLVGMPVARDLWPSLLGQLGSGMRFWLFGGESSRNITPEDMVGLIESTYRDLFKKVGMYVQKNYDSFKPVRRRSMIAAIFATFAVAPNKSMEFWQSICDGIGYTSKQDARWHLRKYIDTHTASKSDSKSFVSDERWYQISIVAWNRWRQHEKVDKLKPSEKRIKPI